MSSKSGDKGQFDLLNAERLASILFEQLGLTAQSTYFVAFSGGLDSMVLLHLMAQLKQSASLNVSVLHVNHQLHPESGQWSDYCRQVSEKLALDYQSQKVTIKSSIEAQARAARYHWFEQVIGDNGVLLTAHHRQDKVETLLFNLLRGAGSKGLSSMRAKRALGAGWCVRPLLDFSKQQLQRYADSYQLQWIDDPSNENIRFTRNHIRHELIPLLNTIRTGAVESIARAAENLQQEQTVLEEVAKQDLLSIEVLPRYFQDLSHAISLSGLVALSEARQINVLRYWLAINQLPTPSRALMQRLIQAIKQPPASTAIYQESGWQFRFYRDFCYMMPEPLKQSFETQFIDKDVVKIKYNNLDLKLSLNNCLLKFISGFNKAKLLLRVREQGEQLYLVDGKKVSIKKWMQTQNIPTWRRKNLPLLIVQTDSQTILIDGLNLKSQWYELREVF